MIDRVRYPVMAPLAWLLLAWNAAAQAGTVDSHRKISNSTPGFRGVLFPDDLFFGSSSTSLGDLDGNGSGDLAVGSLNQDPSGAYVGAVYVLFLEQDGVASYRQIREGESGFVGPLAPGFFGEALCALGDLDGDGIVDLAVGSPSEDEGLNESQGALWILFLDANGTVKGERRIAATSTFGGLHSGDRFGCSVARLGDLDGDGTLEVAVGARRDDALWILSLDPSGSVAHEQKIGESIGGFGGQLGWGDFGYSATALGDLDGDGVVDLAVGGTGTPYGRVWVLFLQTDGTVKAWHRIGGSTGGDLEGLLDIGEGFGTSVGALGDLDGDGFVDLVVGAPLDDALPSFPQDEGALWVLFLNAGGRPRAQLKITEGSAGFTGLDVGDGFGASLSLLDDLDGDGLREIAVGARHDGRGAVWVLSLRGDSTAPVLSCPPAVSAIDGKGSAPGEFVSFVVTASDDADPSPGVLCVPPSGSFFPRGTTIVTCTVTDNAGNESACTFPVTVQPTIRPR